MAISVSPFGLTDEWHLDLSNSFQHFTFRNVSRFRESVVCLWPSLSKPRFEAVGTVSNAMHDDGVKYLLVELLPN